MAETEETPQIDDTRLQAIRRRIDEVVGDAPQLAKLALEQMVTSIIPTSRAQPARPVASARSPAMSPSSPPSPTSSPAARIG